MKRFSGKLLLFLAACALLLAAASAGAEHVHQYSIVSEKSHAPSCLEEGLTYYECPGCGDHYTVSIPAVGHKPGETKVEVTLSPTCIRTGTQTTTVYCKHCNTIISRTTDTIPMTDHTWPTSWTVVTKATCTTSGLEIKDCTVCGTRLESREIPPTGHAWGPWNTVEPTCTTGGYQHRVCGNDPSHTERQSEIPALGHDWGEYVLTTAPTCEQPGIETSTCRRCGATRTRSVPAVGHIWDAGEVTTSPTCTTSGVREYTCLRDPSHTKLETIPKLGHSWTRWDVDPKPTCTEKGRRRHVCTVCGQSYSESMQPLGHDWGPWVLVREATPQQSGVEQRTCQRCGAIEKREVPYKGGNPGAGATMCVFGPRLKDVGTYLSPTSNAWYMFTPFDASVEGSQTYELVVDDSYIVGTATITVENGAVSLTYDLNTASVQVDLEFFTFLPDMHVLSQYEPEDLKPICGMQTGVPYSIAERFGGDTNLVLYFCSRVTYTYDAAGMSALNYFSTYHQALLNNMFRIMDQ